MVSDLHQHIFYADGTFPDGPSGSSEELLVVGVVEQLHQ